MSAERCCAPSSPVVCLVLRLLAFICILVSLVILTTNSTTVVLNSTELKFRFNDVYAYRYALFGLVVGMAYTLLQIVFGIFHLTMGKRISSSDDALLHFDFYADKVMSYILATGTGAAFGATIDLRQVFGGTGSTFFNKGNAAASFLLFAFLFTAVSSIFSSLALSKKP